MGIVTIYPPPLLVHSRHGGVASYSKNLVSSLMKYCSVTIFAEKLSTSEGRHHEAESIHRCWTKGIKYPFQIFKTILKNEVDVFHIQYETYLFGGLASGLIFPLLVALIGLLRKPVIVTMHGVIPLSRLNSSFLRENRIQGNTLIMRIGLTFLVRLIVFLSTAVIVHEENLSEILKKEYNIDASKINVINHGVEEPKVMINSNEAKEKLGVHSKKVILFLGYITGYKNVGLLIDSAKFLKVDNWVILIAGGMHPRLMNDINYVKYVSELRKRAMRISEQNILFKGFVPEEEICSYLSAADLVVFPYNICISSSGPLSLAASYEKPFLATNSFREIITLDEIRFINEPEKLAAKINCFFDDSRLRLRILDWVQKFKMKRSWTKIAKKTYLLYKKLAAT